jgi:bifunctional non-homologous end joining protein LigD
MHVYVPVTGATYAGIKAYARRLATTLAAETPGAVVARMTRALRPGKVFVDWSQNDRGKSTVAPYSLRALRAPTVSAPVTWDEVAGDPARLFFDPPAALERIERYGDLFAPVLTTVQSLPG